MGALSCHIESLTTYSCYSGKAEHRSSQLSPIPLAMDYSGASCPGELDGKESACNAEGAGSISGSGRSPGERNGN